MFPLLSSIDRRAVFNPIELQSNVEGVNIIDLMKQLSVEALSTDIVETTAFPVVSKYAVNILVFTNGATVSITVT